MVALQHRGSHPLSCPAVTPSPPEPGAAAPLRTLRFGHSPDADDAYMFYGFHTGLAAIPGCRVEHVLEDIQSLNRRALERADLEITAVSAHAYARLAGRYAVLSCGASMGMGYGPVVVARAPIAPAALEGRRRATTRTRRSSTRSGSGAGSTSRRAGRSSTCT